VRIKTKTKWVKEQKHERRCRTDEMGNREKGLNWGLEGGRKKDVSKNRAIRGKETML